MIDLDYAPALNNFRNVPSFSEAKGEHDEMDKKRQGELTGGTVHVAI